jgi:DNA-binding IclR family transcriptional regulator
MGDEEKDEDSRQGIQSIEVGVPLLQALVDHGAPMMLRDLARHTGMPAAKAHRYLVSLVRTGLVSQEAHSGRYDLGHFALELGLASLARMDAVRAATPVLDALADEIGETVALAIWGNMGPTIVRWVESPRPVNVNLRTGSVMPLLAFGDRSVLRQLPRVAAVAIAHRRGIADQCRGDRETRPHEPHRTRCAGRRGASAWTVARRRLGAAGDQRILRPDLRPRRQDGAGHHRPGSGRTISLGVEWKHSPRHRRGRTRGIAAPGLEAFKARRFLNSPRGIRIPRRARFDRDQTRLRFPPGYYFRQIPFFSGKVHRGAIGAEGACPDGIL